MLITKEQQEYWIRNYVKEKHNNDEVIGFIDGIQRIIVNTKSNQEFNSISKAAIFYGISISTLNRKLNGKHKNDTDLVFK